MLYFLLYLLLFRSALVTSSIVILLTSSAKSFLYMLHILSNVSLQLNQASAPPNAKYGLSVFSPSSWLLFIGLPLINNKLSPSSSNPSTLHVVFPSTLYVCSLLYPVSSCPTVAVPELGFL